jgi:predicted Ser/Thr protein kinase
VDARGRVASAAPLRPGDPTTVGRYEIRGRIGEGGMGMVYLGRAPDGRDVAVKVVRAELADDAAFRARFRDEVGNAERVASFCTAQVLDHGEDDGRAYMVTEFIDGPSLAEYVERGGALSPGMLHGVAVGVAAGLVAIHAAGLVHRDLKPRNVLLSISGPRVIDFGIARALDEASAHTMTGQVVGSPGWIAPELIQNQAVTTAVDIFAWGCLIAYAGTGRHPFGTGSFGVMAARVLQAAPDIGPLPAPLDRLVLAALNKDPRRRPAAQTLLLTLIGGQRGDAAVQSSLNQTWSSPPPVAYPPPPPPSPPPNPPSEAARAPTEPPRAAAARPKRSAVLAAGGAVLAVAAVAAAGLALRSAFDDTPANPGAGSANTAPPTASGALPADPMLVREDRAAGWPDECHGSVAVLTPGAGTVPRRLLSAAECDMLPRWSPDRRRVAFTRDAGSGAELYVMNADGSGLQKVTEVVGTTRTAWSPDGRRLAYADTTGGNREIFVITIGSSSPQRVTFSDSAEGGPDWSRDGRRLAFWSDRDSVQQIYTLEMNAFGKPWTKVTSAPYGADDAVWSPDGRRIAYTRVNENRRNDIWVIGADGRGDRRLTDDPEHEMDPNWSPDGRWIAFARGAVETPRLWAIRADGSGAARRVTTASRSVGHPGWT